MQPVSPGGTLFLFLSCFLFFLVLISFFYAVDLAGGCHPHTRVSSFVRPTRCTSHSHHWHISGRLRLLGSHTAHVTGSDSCLQRMEIRLTRKSTINPISLLIVAQRIIQSLFSIFLRGALCLTVLQLVDGVYCSLLRCYSLVCSGFGQEIFHGLVPAADAVVVAAAVCDSAVSMNQVWVFVA